MQPSLACTEHVPHLLIEGDRIQRPGDASDFKTARPLTGTADGQIFPRAQLFQELI